MTARGGLAGFAAWARRAAAAAVRPRTACGLEGFAAWALPSRCGRRAAAGRQGAHVPAAMDAARAIAWRRRAYSAMRAAQADHDRAAASGTPAEIEAAATVVYHAEREFAAAREAAAAAFDDGAGAR